MNQNSPMKMGGLANRPSKHQRRKPTIPTPFDLAFFCLILAIIAAAMGCGQ